MADVNWGLFLFGVSAVLVALWVWRLSKRRWSWPGLIASVGCLFAAGLNGAAPFRGFVDPNYVGYSFGLVHADKGIAVTILAGTVFLASAVSALIAVSVKSGSSLWFVGTVCAALLVILGLPSLEDAVRSPSPNPIQFGEYLTIPGVLATVLIIVVLAVPFAVGAIWAPIAARSR